MFLQQRHRRAVLRRRAGRLRLPPRVARRRPIDYLRLPLHTLKVGSHGTHHTLGLAKSHRARFLLASTSEVYGDPQVHPQTEDYWGHVNPIGPRGVYDEAKRYAEALTMAYHRQQGVDTAIVRIFNSILADEQVLFDDGRELRRETVGRCRRALASRLCRCATALRPALRQALPWSTARPPTLSSTRWRDFPVPAFDAEGEHRRRAAPASLVGHPTDERCFEVTHAIRALDQGHRATTRSSSRATTASPPAQIRQ